MKLFVTGGSRGIGKAIVLSAVQSGWDVAFTYQSAAEKASAVEREAKEINPNVQVMGLQMDVSNSDSVAQTIDFVIDTFESIDAVVNNAGINQ